MSGRPLSLLDRRCFEHDFDVQPGFPPSGRKSVNDFERHNVSNPAIDVTLSSRFSPLATQTFVAVEIKQTTQFRASWELANISLTGNWDANGANRTNGDGTLTWS